MAARRLNGRQLAGPALIYGRRSPVGRPPATMDINHTCGGRGPGAPPVSRAAAAAHERPPQVGAPGAAPGPPAACYRPPDATEIAPVGFGAGPRARINHRRANLLCRAARAWPIISIWPMFAATNRWRARGGPWARPRAGRAPGPRARATQLDEMFGLLFGIRCSARLKWPLIKFIWPVARFAQPAKTQMAHDKRAGGRILNKPIRRRASANVSIICPLPGRAPWAPRGRRAGATCRAATCRAPTGPRLPRARMLMRARGRTLN